ncbi:endonuclease/exonuclease/phosphatase family protein [Urechidicola croceus]|uniref:Endonuclease n=1 Tax=Urechidicola croceus TaxID=1850246 RepID=A0A1D8P8X7_9FLAO|nr:endonuclease [Urechidicola croceus]AOW20989.1 endonuclease [Urechidicola croceus]
MNRILLSVLAFFLIANNSFGQAEKNKEYKIRTVGFYNLENLFDTINDLETNYQANPMFEVKGDKSKVYWEKINNMAKVISEIGVKDAHSSPAIVGVVEIENKEVLEDLINSKHLKDDHYDIIHYHSPDKRGIDVGMIYQKRYFKPVSHESFELKLYNDEGERIFTRDQLLVSGYLDDELVHIIVNHWPSRRGGEAKSRPLREKAAALNMTIIDKIRETEPNAKIITMGDLNDDPINTSVKKVLNAKGKKKQVEEGDIYNPFEEMFRRGLSTLGYRDNINLFDQILFTSPFMAEDYSTYQFYKAGIFNPRYLTSKKGRYKGYPFRSFSYGKFTGGYSDHYPTYIYLIKEK